MKKYGVFLAIFLVLLIPEFCMADYTTIIANNNSATETAKTLTKPWITFMVAWGFIIAFIAGLGGSFAFQWAKAKEERKDVYGIFFKSLLIAFMIGWVVITLTDMIIGNLTGSATAGETIRTDYWKSLLGI